MNIDLEKKKCLRIIFFNLCLIILNFLILVMYDLNNNIIFRIMIFIMFFSLGFIYTNVSNIKMLLKMKKYFNKLNISDELNKIKLYFKSIFIFTDNYLILNGNKLKFVCFNDVILISFNRGFSINTTIKIYLENGSMEKIIFVENDNKGITIENILSIMTKKNNNILIGKTADNVQKIYEKYGIKI